MKVAIAYDWLNVKTGGGEHTLFAIAQLYPDADIHCLVYNKNKFAEYLGSRTIICSRLQRLPGFIKKRPNLMLPFIQKAVDKMDFSGYDLVISVSSAWVKNISVPEGTVHISYCFSPARMLWDSWPGYLDTQKIGPLRLGRLGKFFITKRVSKLRLWDYYSTRNVDEFIAISQYVARRIHKFYGRESSIVYPPVEMPASVEMDKSDSYLVLSVLSYYKNIDLVIRAFKKNKKQLIIAGDGPDKQRLMELVGNSTNITFTGRVSDKQKAILMARAKAFVFPSLEDFGIAPVEALASGTPVIALKGGGLQETVAEDKTGVFFDQPTVESLNKAIARFEKLTFSPKKLRSTATKFSRKNFDDNFVATTTTLYKKVYDDKN